MNLSDRDVSSISLRQSLGPASFVGCGDIVASRFCNDSRQVRPGDVFVAVRGATHDGHLFMEQAVLSGASAVVIERPHPTITVPQCVVPDSRVAMAAVSMALRGWPGKLLAVSGITGTNGKTTSGWLLRSILEAAGRRTGLLGTIEYSDGRSCQNAALTTPDAELLAILFARMVRADASHCVMEISSHALEQRRCSGMRLTAAAITNITQDHFDYHGDFEHYRSAKALIAGLLKPEAPLLVGIDDPGCRSLLSLLPSGLNVLTFGFDRTANIRAEILSSSKQGQSLRLDLSNSSVEIQTSLVGRHNVLNLLTAAALAEQQGIEPEFIRAGLQRIAEVPGRMERIEGGQPFTVLVDYAHTPDSVANCVAAARTLTAGRVILVFGAGGDRDKSKRPLMARAAETADVVIVTSDNPRSEDARQIIDEICLGFDSHAHVHTRADRFSAIRHALTIAECGDVVMIAGRGHETTQQIGDRHICFDDRKVARLLLRERMNETSDLSVRCKEPISIPA